MSKICKILNANQDTPTAQQKWSNELLPENFKWDKIYSLPFKITKYTNLRWFQYRLVHRILATNTFLCKIGIKQDNRCSFCNTHQETLKHIFWECDIVNTFWHNVENWMKDVCAHITDLNLAVHRHLLYGPVHLDSH